MKRTPCNPGRLLKVELVSRKRSGNRLSLDIGVRPGRITDILHGRHKSRLGR